MNTLTVTDVHRALLLYNSLFFGKVDKDKLLFTFGMTKRLRAIELSAFNFVCFSVGDFGMCKHFKE